MNRQEVLQFVARHPLFYLATLDGKQPRVRAMMLALSDEDGLVFCTGRDKNVSRQLRANPTVELCFPNEQDRSQLRVCGQVEEFDDREVKERIVRKFDFLKPWVEKEGYEFLATFRLSAGQAALWTQEHAFEPVEYAEF